MTDAELIARLRELDGWVMLGAHTHLATAARIEALTEQLAAAQRDAKEAEAYAEELEQELNACRMAQAVMDYTVADLEGKLAECEARLGKAVAALKECTEEIDAYIQQEYPHDHPVQERYRQRDYAANPARLALAEIKGESHD